MNYIIFDLESTCWEGAEGKKHQSEVIEIGAVKLNSKLETVDIFQSFIKPTINPTLTPFCMRLTTIKQSDVNNAPVFDIVLPKFIDWISDGGKTPYWLCSWGFYDRKMLSFMCKHYGKADRWLKFHISVKHQFAEIKGTATMGMPSALNMLNIPLDGIHHRGLDDAKNIAKIFTEVYPNLVFKT